MAADTDKALTDVRNIASGLSGPRRRVLQDAADVLEAALSTPTPPAPEPIPEPSPPAT